MEYRETPAIQVVAYAGTITSSSDSSRDLIRYPRSPDEPSVMDTLLSTCCTDANTTRDTAHLVLLDT